MTDLFSRSCWHSCRRLQWLRRSLRRAPQAVIAVGMQAAALVIAKPLAGAAGFSDRAVDLRVDDHRTPIPELRRVYNVLRSNQILTEVMVAFRDSRPDDALRIVLTARDLSPENDNVWWASPIFTWRWAARANASTPYAGCRVEPSEQVGVAAQPDIRVDSERSRVRKDFRLDPSGNNRPSTGEVMMN